jgi:hypothetical protein
MKHGTGLSPDNNGRNGLRHDRDVASRGKHSPSATLVLVEKPVVKHGSGAAYNCVMTLAVLVDDLG